MEYSITVHVSEARNDLFQKALQENEISGNSYSKDGIFNFHPLIDKKTGNYVMDSEVNGFSFAIESVEEFENANKFLAILKKLHKET